jgi:Cd2+/Zn2+-exporting ATPase
LLAAGFVVTNLVSEPEIGKWLYLASAIVGGVPLFLFAARQILVKHDITAGVMASIAMIAAIIVGEYSAAALVVFMMSVGEWLENFTVARADNALKDLASLIPSTVTVRRDGADVVIPIEQVMVDEIVLVHAGERFGVDGIVIRGNGCVNQAAITGESIPVDKIPGDEVFAGTMNDMGVLEIRVSRLGENTALGKIVKLVKEAQDSQAPVQRVANRYARILVPATIMIAVLVYVLSGEVIRAITVLVVVCPCALVLATPTAVVASIGNAAKNGILVKAGSAIEMAGKVDVVALDKTGTLTKGKPVVQDVVSLNGMDSNTILAMAGSLERISEHPIGKAIVEACKNRSLILDEPENVKIEPGFGVTGNLNRGRLVVGTRALLMENGSAWNVNLEQKIRNLENSGQSVIPVGLNKEVVGIITLVDQPRVEAKRTISKLKKLGIKEVIMITGDNPFTAERIAKELGIDRFYAQVLPHEKLKVIRDLQTQGHKVLFAGDGVNDAPALAAADLGVAMGMGGTDIALETAEIGLMADEIERLPQIIELSKKALRVIKANVIFSMLVNVIALSLGAFGLIGPVLGALIHEGSSIPVLINAARLVNFKPDR